MLNLFRQRVSEGMPPRTDKLFNVRVDGKLIAEGWRREAAQYFLTHRTPFTFVQIYLADNPMEGRKAPHRYPHLPRPVSLYVSGREREALRAKLLADGTLTETEE